MPATFRVIKRCASLKININNIFNDLRWPITGKFYHQSKIVKWVVEITRIRSRSRKINRKEYKSCQRQYLVTKFCHSFVTIFLMILHCLFRGTLRDRKLVGPKTKLCKKHRKIFWSTLQTFSHFLTPHVALYILLPRPSGPSLPLLTEPLPVPLKN